jgi:hypothetical protein
MATFNDGEDLDLVRGKLNAVLGNVELILDPAALVADTAFTYTSGQARTVSVGTRIVSVVGGHTYQVVASGASTFDLQTAGGVRVLLLPNGSGWYDFDGMAPFKDGVTDNLAKLQKLLDKMVFIPPEQGWNGPSINFSAGRYYFSDTINLKCIVQLYGTTTGFGNNQQTQFIFPDNKAGIIVNRHNTFGDQTLTEPPYTGADASEIVGINLTGGRGSAFDPTKSGIWMRARAYINKCTVRNFAGHGIWAGAGSDGNPYLGNCNLFRVDQVWIQLCRGDGFCSEGTDANAGSCFHIDAKNNDGWGVREWSFLGNYHFGHHSESNLAGCYTSRNGSRLTGSYAEDGLGGTAQWGGILDGSTISLHNKTAGSGTAGQAPILGFEYANGPRAMRNENGGFIGLNNDIQAHLGSESDTIVSGRHADNATPFRMGAYQGTNAEDVVYRWGSSVNTLMRFGSANTTWTFGRSAAVGEHLNINGFWLGFNNNARYRTAGTAAPTTGTWARGDIVENINIASGQPMGWGCSVAGSPGTWIAMPNWP